MMDIDVHVYFNEDDSNGRSLFILPLPTSLNECKQLKKGNSEVYSSVDSLEATGI
jgi:hypothetical protein